MNHKDTVYTIADRYVESLTTNLFSEQPGSSNRWVHLIHNWRTGGSSLTALLSVNFHDSYLKVGHPFTRDGWPVDYSLNPYQVTEASQLTSWIQYQASPAILLSHTYYGMASNLACLILIFGLHGACCEIKFWLYAFMKAIKVFTSARWLCGSYEGPQFQYCF